MTRTFRITALALILAATLLSGIGGMRGAAANGNNQVVGPFANGCYYEWNGSEYVAGACPRSDGGVDYYVASYGQWVFHSTVIWTSEGGQWIYSGGLWYYFAPVYGTSGVASSGGQLTDTQIGGWAHDNLTDNVGANDIILGSHGTNGIPTQPICVELINGICYQYE